MLVKRSLQLNPTVSSIVTKSFIGLAAVITFIFPADVRGQVWTSTSGSLDNLFFNSANWSSGSVPNSATTVASFTNNLAGINQTVELSNSVLLNRLVFSTTTYAFTTANSSGITLTGSTPELLFTGLAAATTISVDLSPIALSIGSLNSRISISTAQQNNAPLLKLGAVHVDNGASLLITRTGSATNSRTATLTQVGAFFAGGDVSIQNRSTLGTNNTFNVNLGDISGVGALTITGGGAATNVNVASYSSGGDVNVFNATTTLTLGDFNSNGRLSINDGSVFITGGFSGTGGISFTAGRLQFKSTVPLNVAQKIDILSAAGGGIEIRNSASSNSNTVTISGNISNDGAGSGLRTLTLAGQNGGSNLLLSTLTDGAAGNTLGLIRDGSGSGATNGGVWYLGGTNSFSGGITVGSSVLGFSSAANLGAATNIITLGNSVTNTSAVLTLSDATAPVTLGNTFRLTGTDAGGAIIRNNSSGTAALTISSAASFAVTSSVGRKVTFGGTNTALNEVAAVLADDVSGTQLSVVKVDAGTWLLSGHNAFSGLSTLAGGTLIVKHADSLGTAAWNVTGGTLRADSAPLSLGNTLNLLGQLTLSGDISLTLSGNVTVSGAARTIENQNITTTHYLSGGTIFLGEDGASRDLTLTGAAGSTLLVQSTITSGTGTTGGSVLYGGAGNFLINGANSYSGTTSLNGGTYTVGNNLAFGASVINYSNGTLQTGTTAVTLANDVLLRSQLTLSGAASLTLGGTVTSNTHRTIAAFNSSGVYLNNIALNATAGPATTLTLGGDGGIVILGLISEAGTTTAGVNITNTSAAGVTFRNLPAYRNATNIAAGSRLNLDLSTDYTYTRVISGGGDVALNPNHAVTVTYAAAQTYSGVTSVLSGTLVLAGGDNRLAVNSSLAVSAASSVNLDGANQTLASLNGTGRIFNGVAATNSSLTVSGGAYTGSLSDGDGTLSLYKIGAGLLTLGATSGNYSGGTTILGGTLAAGTALPGAGNVTLSGGVLGLNGNQTLQIGTGAGQLRWTATGGLAAVGGDLTVRFELDGNLATVDTLTWGTTVATGTFLINGQGLLLGSTSADGRIEIASPIFLSNNSGQQREFSVIDNPNVTTDYAVFSSTLAGSTQFKKTGAGLLIFTGNNINTGTINLLAGTVQVGDGGATGQIAAGSARINNNAVLQFNRNNLLTVTNHIAGTGSLRQIGSGTTVLTGSNAYSGATFVDAGTLVVTGTLFNSAVSVSAGAVLSGTGTLGTTVDNGGSLVGGLTVAGIVTNEIGGVIAPGGIGTVGTLTLGGLVLNGGTLNFDLGLLGDQIWISGGAFNVTASTGLNWSALTGFDVGTYDLVSGFSGAIGGFGFLSPVTSFSGYSLSLADVGGVLRLTVTTSGGGGGGGTITGTHAGVLDVASGSVTVANGGITTGTVNVSGGLLAIASGGRVGNTLGVNVTGGALNVQSGGQIIGNGQITVGSGTLSVDGDVEGRVTIQSGGVVNGTGSVGAVTVQAGGTLSVGHSVGTLTLDGGGLPGSQSSLQLNGGSNLVFEFNDATGTAGNPAGGWDYIELGAGTLTLNATGIGSDKINLHIDSLTLANVHGTAANFNAAPGTIGNVQEYYWKFIGLTSTNQISKLGYGSINGLFDVTDDAAGNGVFFDPDFGPNGNPFARPESALGQGTFKVLAGDFGQGNGLYIYYSAIPEPGSLILTGLGTLAAGWYGKRRRKKSTSSDVATTQDAASV